MKLRERAPLPDTCHVVLDDYLPIQFSTYDEPLGAGYLRMGGGESLLELVVEPRTQVLRGLTLTAMALISPWPVFKLHPVRPELPAISTSFTGYKVIELPIAFRVATQGDRVLIWWGQLEHCEQAGFDRACFLLEDGDVVGALFTSVPNADARMRSHVRCSE